MTIDLDHGLPEPPLDGHERKALTWFLDYQRATFAWKIATTRTLMPRPARPLMPMTALLAGMLLPRVELFRRMRVAVLED